MPRASVLLRFCCSTLFHDCSLHFPFPFPCHYIVLPLTRSPSHAALPASLPLPPHSTRAVWDTVSFISIRIDPISIRYGFNWVRYRCMLIPCRPWICSHRFHICPASIHISFISVYVGPMLTLYRSTLVPCRFYVDSFRNSIDSYWSHVGLVSIHIDPISI